jgi:hypothetical protein
MEVVYLKGFIGKEVLFEIVARKAGKCFGFRWSGYRLTKFGCVGSDNLRHLSRAASLSWKAPQPVNNLDAD